MEHDHSPGYTQFRYLMLALYFIFAPVVTSLTMSLELYVNTRYLFEKSPEPYVATFERLRRFNAIIFDGILQSMIQIQVLSTNHKHAETRTMIASLFISTLNLLWNSYNLWNNIRLDYRPAPYYVRDLFKAGLTGIHGLDDVQAGVKDLLYEGREHIEHQFDVITIAKQLGDLPQEVVKVRRLRLRRCDVDDRGASALCIMLSRNRSLKRPNLEHGIITSKGATQLANSLLRNTVLNHLHLHENLIEDPGLTHLSAILRDPRCAPITTFEISSNKYSTPGIKALAKTLQKLVLADHKIPDAGAIALGRGLETNTTLTYLDMQVSEITDRGASGLAAGLCHSRLSYLNLSGNDFGDAGATALGQVVEETVTLKTLKLDGNEIGDKGGVMLAEAVGYYNASVTEFDLRYNNIGVDSLKILAEVLRRNSTLVKLSLAHNKMTDAKAFVRDEKNADIARGYHSTIRFGDW